MSITPMMSFRPGSWEPLSGISGADSMKQTHLIPDVQNCNSRGVDYMPVVLPGFSWSNWKEGAGHRIQPTPPSRRRITCGDRRTMRKPQGPTCFIWPCLMRWMKQPLSIKQRPTAATSPQVIFAPTYTNQWVRLDIDGHTLPSDWYLQVCGEINRMYKGERTVVGTLPISPNSLPTITSTPVTVADIGSAVQLHVDGIRCRDECVEL